MSRTNIDLDDELVEIVMVRYQLKTKRDAVDYALRHLAGQPRTREEMIQVCGSMPDFELPEDPTDFEPPAQRERHDNAR